MARDKGRDYFVCPHCGAEVRAGARACPECGSDEATGWAEDADKWAAGIPAGYGGEDDFDYEEFVRREFGGRRAHHVLGLPWWMALPLVGALVAGLLILLW
jgi:hypothetical protein